MKGCAWITWSETESSLSRTPLRTPERRLGPNVSQRPGLDHGRSITVAVTDKIKLHTHTHTQMQAGSQSFSFGLKCM